MIGLARTALLSLALVGCVEQNARWDPPASSSSSTSGGSSEGSSTSSGAAESSGPSSPEASSSTGEPVEPCEGNWQQVCGGACRDTKDDPQACGATCTDCTVTFGPHARCHTGTCRPPGGGSDD